LLAAVRGASPGGAAMAGAQTLRTEQIAVSIRRGLGRRSTFGVVGVRGGRSRPNRTSELRRRRRRARERKERRGIAGEKRA